MLGLGIEATVPHNLDEVAVVFQKGGSEGDKLWAVSSGPSSLSPSPAHGSDFSWSGCRFTQRLRDEIFP